MKKFITLIVLLSSALIGNSQIIKSGLVGFWPFNGNANDESTNTNNGTVTGATLTKDRFGKVNSAYKFDGNADYINLGKHSSMFPSNITVNIWFRYSAMNSVMAMVGNYNSNTGEEGLILWSIDGKGVGATMGAGLNNHLIAYQSKTNYNDDKWHMATLVYSKTDNTRFAYYIDGCFSGYNNIVGSSGGFSITDFLTFDKTQDWYVGASSQYFHSSSNNGPRYFKGDLDDLSIYNRPLSSMEVMTLYTGQIVYDTATIIIFDTTKVVVYDTTFLKINDTTIVTIFDTTKVVVYDTTLVKINDTTFVTIYDTSRTSVTDTLRIRVRDNSTPAKWCQIKIYPNPTDNILYIDPSDDCELAGYKLRVMDDIGQVVYKTTLDGNLFTLDLSKLVRNGFYVVAIENKDGVLIATKIIVLY